MLGQAWKPVNFLLLSAEGMMAVWVGGFIEPPHLVRKPQVTGAEITRGLWKNNGIIKAARFTWEPFCFVFRCSLKDFGEYQESYYSVQTTEGEQISQLIAGYIDIILKKARHLLKICLTAWRLCILLCAPFLPCYGSLTLTMSPFHTYSSVR